MGRGCGLASQLQRNMLLYGVRELHRQGHRWVYSHNWLEVTIGSTSLLRWAWYTGVISGKF